VANDKMFLMVILAGIAYGNRLLNSGMGITSCSLQIIQENVKVSFDKVQVPIFSHNLWLCII
jgi:hypothetical protein